MLSEISVQLTQVIEKRKLKEKIEGDLAQVTQDLDTQNKRMAELEQRLKKEQVDVERLERLSLAGLFYSVLGSREQQTEKERQELLAAQLKYQQARQTIHALHSDQADLEARLKNLQGVEDEYSALMAHKEILLSQLNPQIAAGMTHLSMQIADRNAEKREVDEALAAASLALESLDQVIESLENAEGWGYWDILGGNLLTTALKHSHIDDARAAVEDAQAQISRFNRELADVKRSTNIAIEIGGLEIFADYFLDGLIVDWIVQSKIQESLEQSRQTKAGIARAVENLNQLKSNLFSQLQDLSDQHTRLIEQS